MRTKYMLDTDTVSYALRGQGRVMERLRVHRRSELAVSALAVAELRIGAATSKSQKIDRAISSFLADLPVLAFDESAAEHFASIGAALEDAGHPSGNLDTLIAAHARSIGAVLVTNNTRHFGRVPGLLIETWV